MLGNLIFAKYEFVKSSQNLIGIYGSYVQQYDCTYCSLLP